jgi:hypothetical protein
MVAKKMQNKVNDCMMMITYLNFQNSIYAYINSRLGKISDIRLFSPIPRNCLL